MVSLPVVPDFAAGLAAAVGQLSTALRLPTGWVASPSLRWTPSGATLLVRWGPPASSRAPGGGEHSKTKRSAAQQRRSALRAAAHRERKEKQQQRSAQQLRPEAPFYIPNSDQPPLPPETIQPDSAVEMEVGEEGRVRERDEQQEQPAATHTAGRDCLQAAHLHASSPSLTKGAALGPLGTAQTGQLQAGREGASTQGALYRSRQSPPYPHPPFSNEALQEDKKTGIYIPPWMIERDKDRHRQQ
jgi:hypothetical protein